jgi:hypothetical protein
MLVMLSASSVAASGTKEEIEKKWNSLFNLKVFERFKVLKATFEAIRPTGQARIRRDCYVVRLALGRARV